MALCDGNVSTFLGNCLWVGWTGVPHKVSTTVKPLRAQPLCVLGVVNEQESVSGILLEVHSFIVQLEDLAGSLLGHLLGN